jgi:hypothetical protein
MVISDDTTIGRQLLNWLRRPFLRLGGPPRGTHQLTVRERTSGKPRSVSVALVEEGGERWIVAPSGEVDWVHDVRAADGWGTLDDGRHREPVELDELTPEEAAPVLRAYVERVPANQRFLTLSSDSSLAAFAAEAARHPVFRVVSADRS